MESLPWQLMPILACVVRKLLVLVLESHCLAPACSVLRGKLMIMFLVVDLVLLLLLVTRLLYACLYSLKLLF